MFLKELKDLNILFLTEMFYSRKIPDSFYIIPGYALFRKDRFGKFKKGSGVLAFATNLIIVKRRSDFKVSDIEPLWLKVCPHKSNHSLFVGGIFGPPSNKVKDDKKLVKNIKMYN